MLYIFVCRFYHYLCAACDFIWLQHVNLDNFFQKIDAIDFCVLTLSWLVCVQASGLLHIFFGSLRSLQTALSLSLAQFCSIWTIGSKSQLFGNEIKVTPWDCMEKTHLYSNVVSGALDRWGDYDMTIWSRKPTIICPVGTDVFELKLQTGNLIWVTVSRDHQILIAGCPTSMPELNAYWRLYRFNELVKIHSRLTHHDRVINGLWFKPKKVVPTFS